MTTDAEIKEGIIPNLSEEAYRAAEGVNQSSLKLMDISPRHYLTEVTKKPEPPTDAQRMGTLTHRLILQDRREFVVRPEGMKFTTKEGMAWRDAQKQEIITVQEERDLLGMRASVLSHPIAKAILERPGDNEVACFKRCPDTGLMLKGRADRVCMDNEQRMVIPDLKTCPHGDGNKEDFTRAIYKWGYEIQSSFYLDLFGASFFVFIVVEKDPPYACAVYSLDSRAVAYGRKRYKELLAKVKQCVDLGEWPAYSEQMEQISLPEWELKKEGF